MEQKLLVYTACALVLIGLVAALPAAAAGDQRVSVNVQPVSGIDVEKYVSIDGGQTWLDADTATGPRLVASGPAPQFRFVVTNTGGSALTGVALTDSILGPITVPSNLVGGASVEVVRTGTWAPGQHINVATATGSKGSDTYTDSDSANYFGAAPAIEVEKYVSADGGSTWLDADAATGPALVASGPAPQFRFSVTNPGNVVLSGVALVDSVFGTLVVPGTLAVGGSAEVVVTGTWAGGQHTNVATASGSFTDDAGNTQAVSDSDAANYFGAAPSIGIVALTNGQDADTPPGPSVPVGGPVQWTYIVTNSGTVTLTNVAVTDDQGVVVTAPKTVLQPGESMTATASGTALAGQYANIGTVTGTPPTGPDVTASNPSHYYGITPPVAGFSANATTGLAPLAVQFTDTSTGDGITGWSWDFGDGETSTESDPVHVYADAGTYTVHLTITSAAGSDNEVKTDYISVLPDTTPIGGDIGYFLVTTDPAGAEIYLEDIGATRYHVGNTTTGPLNVSIYLTATPMRKIIANLTGYHDAVFTITQYPAKDQTLPVDLTLDPIAPPTPAPVASFTANVTNGIAPLAVLFTDTSTGDGITGWSWDFDDDGTVDSAERDPVHTYTVPGTYTVNLTVANAGGSDSEVRARYISVLPDMPPIGGDRGYFLVSTVPAGAEIYLESISHEQYHVGNTSAGPLNVTIMLTAAPMRKIIANLSGYANATYAIVQYPAKDGTLPVDLVLEPQPTPTPTPTAPLPAGDPYPGPHVPATVIQAEDFDAGGEGVAYHDLEPRNLGGAYRPAEGVDIETVAGVTDVGWIRAGEHLDYSIDTTIAGRFTLTLRAANPDATAKPVTVYLDGVPAGQVLVDGTGSWTTYGEFAGAVPMTISTGRHVVTLAFEGINRVNLDWLRLAAGTVPTVTTTATTPPGATFTAAPLTARYGSAVKFTLTPKAGKTVKSVWWSFDAPAHLRTWNSRATNPTFFYPRPGSFSPLVKITYTDNSVEEIRRADYIHAT